MKADPGLAVVIDTNVWISAFLSDTSVPAVLVRQVIACAQPVLSTQTAAELETRLWLPKFDRYIGIDERRRLLHDVFALAQWVDVPAELAARRFCRDASDDKFVQTALAAQAAFLVTGDQDLLTMPPADGLRILTPRDALPLLMTTRS